jgi:hypothetical protein
MRARTGTWNTRLRHLEAVLERAEELSEQGGAARRAEGKGELGSRAPHGAKGQKLRFLKRLTGGGGLEGKNP